MIEVYTKPSCPSCINAKRLLESKGIKYLEIKIGEDISREVFLGRFPTALTVPQITIDGNLVGGYEDLKAYFA